MNRLHGFLHESCSADSALSICVSVSSWTDSGMKPLKCLRLSGDVMSCHNIRCDVIRYDKIISSFVLAGSSLLHCICFTLLFSSITVLYSTLLPPLPFVSLFSPSLFCISLRSSFSTKGLHSGLKLRGNRSRPETMLRQITA